MTTPDPAATSTVQSPSKAPQFLGNKYSASILRIWDWFHVDQWNPRDGWFVADPGRAMDEATSPQWYEITPTEAQLRINRNGGAPEEYLAEASKVRTPKPENVTE